VYGASIGKMAYVVWTQEDQVGCKATGWDSQTSTGIIGFTDINRIHTGGETTDWVSDTSVRYQLGQGVQELRRLVVTAGERSGSVTHAWSTDVPSLSVMQVDNSFSDSARS